VVATLNGAATVGATVAGCAASRTRSSSGRLPGRQHRPAPAGLLHVRDQGRERRNRGAVGIVIFNQGDTADPARQGIPAVTLTANNTSGLPVLGTTYALGANSRESPACG
jgi:hypothetical protein